MNTPKIITTVPPDRLDAHLLFDPPLHFDLRACVDTTLRLRLGGFVFNNLVIRSRPGDNGPSLEARYHAMADRLKPGPREDYQI